MLNKFDEILLASPENDMSFPILTFKGTVLINIPEVCFSLTFPRFKIGEPITNSSKFEVLPI